MAVESDFARILPVKFGEMGTLISPVFFSRLTSPASQCHTQHVTLMLDRHSYQLMIGSEGLEMSDKIKKNGGYSIKGMVKIKAHSLQVAIMIIHFQTISITYNQQY